jgi:hypothetical protein
MLWKNKNCVDFSKYNSVLDWIIKLSTDFRVVILGIRAGGRVGKQSNPLRQVWTRWATVERKIIVPNLLYCNNFFYYCQSTWWWAIWGGCSRKCIGRQWEILQLHAGTGESHERCTNGSRLRARMGGRGQHSSVDVKWMHGREGMNGGCGLTGACSKCSIGRTIAKFCDHLQ